MKVAPKQSSFNDCVEMLLGHEGGFANHPRDPGKATNMGITIGTLTQWRGKRTTVEDVKALERKEAKQIYLSRYWNVMRCDEMPRGFDYMLFDFGVNAGPRRAVRFLQALLAQNDPDIEVDGVVGPHTLAVVGTMPTRKLIEQYHQAKMRHYSGLSTWDVFGPGWTRRAREVLERARAMAGYRAEVGE